MISIPGLFKGVWRRPPRRRKKFGLHSEWRHALYGPDGELLRCGWSHNTWHDEGDQYVLGVCFSTTTKLGTCFVGLDSRSTLDKTQTFAQAITYEEDGGGYVREEVDPDAAVDPVGTFAVAYDSTEERYEATSTLVVFAATDAEWQSNRNAFLCAGAEGGGSEILICSAAFDDPYTVPNGGSLNIDFVVALREAA